MMASELPQDVILNHLHIVEEYADAAELEYIKALNAAAVSFVCEYCNIEKAYIDTHDELAVAVLVLIGDMFDNRTRYVEKDTLNRTVETVLSLHDHNLIGEDAAI